MTRPLTSATTCAAPFPGPWSWHGPAAHHDSPAPGTLTLTAGSGTDRYAMPGLREVDELPAVLHPVTGDFTLRATVTVDGGCFADAAGVLVEAGGGWLKTCVERTTTGAWAIITVASWPTSDEAMGPALAGGAAELAVTRQGRRLAVLFREPDTPHWRFARTVLTGGGPARAGLFAQAPFSPSCTARFTAVSLSPEPMPDRR